jgi:hypothetical protein
MAINIIAIAPPEVIFINVTIYNLYLNEVFRLSNSY